MNSFKTFLASSLLVLVTSPAFVRSQPQMTASWYGPGFHGNTTANGETYDMHGFTAAHKSLPFGTRLLVCNVLEGRCVEVRVNDRGPFIAGRDLDLSYAAAKAIRLVEPGVQSVTVFEL